MRGKLFDGKGKKAKQKFQQQMRADDENFASMVAMARALTEAEEQQVARPENPPIMGRGRVRPASPIPVTNPLDDDSTEIIEEVGPLYGSTEYSFALSGINDPQALEELLGSNLEEAPEVGQTEYEFSAELPSQTQAETQVNQQAPRRIREQYDPINLPLLPAASPAPKKEDQDIE
jgi:hypothetical protein